MKRVMEKKYILVLIFLALCSFSFAQNIKITGIIPRTDTGKMYQLQIGAFRLAVNVKEAGEILTRNGFVPHHEKIGSLVRVFVIVNANEVRASVDRLGRAGFKEVIIREYTAGTVIPRPAAAIKPAETAPLITEPVKITETVKIEPEEIVLPVKEEPYFEEYNFEDYAESYEIPAFESAEQELMHFFTE